MKRRFNGVVIKCGAKRSVTVHVERVFRHNVYGKVLRRTLVCHVHDEREQARLGDVVEIIESRPLSKLKRWSLVSVFSQ